MITVIYDYGTWYKFSYNKKSASNSVSEAMLWKNVKSIIPKFVSNLAIGSRNLHQDYVMNKRMNRKLNVCTSLWGGIADPRK